ncbi:MAG: D-cysteine desulfhydrase [Deltaproteobacteria bacterium]|nr:D-cysteine desulfhydrase [Deltaproteobacteria bacterium]
MTRPKKLKIAQTPTPIVEASRLSQELGILLRVKRDDLTGSHLSGNKVRKLEYLLAEAVTLGATHVITCGGVQSNHCRATAWAARGLGLEPVLLLRTPLGERTDLPQPPTGNVLLDLLAGATIHLCTPDGYRERDARMAELADELRSQGAVPYVIPEGGSNALGAMGYVEAARELVEQTRERPPTSVIVATGSGGTLAGLALGLREAGCPAPAIGMAVCDDQVTFETIAARISDEAQERFDLKPYEPDGCVVIDRYQGRGYALSTHEELELLKSTALRDGLILDPVYTIKAWNGLLDLARSGDPRLGDRPVFIHTGGLFGMMAASQQLAPLLGQGAP